MDITFTPRLTKGRHITTVDEHGPFCLVEAVGFNVDGKVHDEHPSVDRVLAALGRTINDRMCKHYSHPLAEAAGMITPDTSGICDKCQDQLWAVGKRIAGTGYDTPDWSEGELAAVHVGLALVAAHAVKDVIDTADPLHAIVTAALDAAAACLADPTDEHKAAARLGASRIENEVNGVGNVPSAWAGQAASNAVRAAAASGGDALDTVSTTYFFANRRAIETMTYALGATEGDAVASMKVAEHVLDAFEKATSQKATPGESSYVPMGNRAAYLAAAELRERAEAEHHGCEECAAAEHVDLTKKVPVWMGGLVEADTVHPDDAGAAAADAAEPWEARAAYEEAYAAAAAVQNATDNEVVDDFEESEIGDVADEAIGDLHRVEARAEAILRAVAEEHRPVEAWTRRRTVGFKDEIEYRAQCCVVCRDANGQPVPAPCRTMTIINGY